MTELEFWVSTFLSVMGAELLVFGYYFLRTRTQEQP